MLAMQDHKTAGREAVGGVVRDALIFGRMDLKDVLVICLILSGMPFTSRTVCCKARVILHPGQYTIVRY